MKGKITIEVEYDSTRIPTGDTRHDFVTNVVVDGLSEGLSFKEAQGFKESIAYGVNEVIALTPDKDTPPEKWPIIDTVWALYYIIRIGGSFNDISGYRNIRHSSHYEITHFFRQITQKLSPLALEYVTMENQRTEFISAILFDQLLDGALEQVDWSTDINMRNLSHDEIKTGLRYLLGNQNTKKKYKLSLVCGVLKDVYKVLDEELSYFLCFGGHRSLVRALDEDPYIDLDGISSRLNVEHKLFEAQVNVYSLAEENEAS